MTLRHWIAAALVLGASGCGSLPKERGICPRVAILAEAGRIASFRPGAPETPENLAFAGQMTDVRISCFYRDRLLSELEADVVVTMVLEKGPAMSGERAEFPYFVTVTDRRGTVLGKRVFSAKVDFAGRRAVEYADTSWQFYRFDKGASGLAYEVWTGFQLDPRELDYNRRAQR